MTRNATGDEARVGDFEFGTNKFVRTNFDK